MKRVISIALAAMLLGSCSKDSGTGPDDGGNQPPPAWSAIDTVSFEPYAMIGAMLLDGDRLLVAGQGGFLGVVDISNPNSLNLQGYSPSTGSQRFPSTRILKVGNHALVGRSHVLQSDPDTIVVYDVSNPAAPTRAAVFESPLIGFPNTHYRTFSDLKLAGDTLAVMWEETGVSFYRVVPGSPPSFQFLSETTFSSGYVVLTGEYWYFFQPYASPPSVSVRSRGTLDSVYHGSLPGELYGMSVPTVQVGTTLYFLDNSQNQRLFVVDLSAPQAISITKTVAVPGDLGLPADIELGRARLGAGDGSQFLLLGDYTVLLNADFEYLRHTRWFHYGAFGDTLLFVADNDDLMVYRQ